MANLMNNALSIPIGTIIDAVGPPDSKWLKCNGDILAQADYPNYVNDSVDIHPLRWSKWEPIFITNASAYSRLALSRIGDLIVSIGTNNLVHVSDDGGLTWSSNIGLPATGTWYCLSNNGTRFTALQNNSNVGAYSTNGVDWTSIVLPVSGYWNQVIYNGTNFLAVPSSGNNFIYSSDGITWYSVACPFASGIGPLDTDGIIFLIYCTDDYKFYKSTNCTSWTSSDPFPVNEVNQEVGQIIYADNKWYSFVTNSYNFHYHWNSDDPFVIDSWKFESMPPKSLSDYMMIDKAIYTGEDFILMDGDSDSILISNNGLNWKYHRMPFNGAYDIIVKNNEYAIMAVYSVSQNCFYRSTYTDYDPDVYFQLPHYPHCENSGVYKYIKVR